MKTVRLELLLGRMVHDSEGAKVGRLFEVHAEMEGEDCVVREYELGAYGLLARLGISFGSGKPLRVPWDQLDLDDPERPRLRCRRDELRA